MRQSSAEPVDQLLTRKDDVLTPQSAATRARLVGTAERLFADRGIESVTLAEINIAAGQRNKNATHYHFGDKEDRKSTRELQSLMRISYAVYCLKKKKSD